MTTYTQFSVFMVTRPGVLTQACRALAEAKVNIVAMTMMDTMEHGVMRVVCEDAGRARAALQNGNFSFSESEVLAVEMPNRPGAAADVCEKLATGKVAISYMYCSTSGGGGKAIGIFRVNNLDRAKKALTATNKTSRTVKVGRRQPALRR
ncbi:MAG: hypothetical protein HOP29_12210 [Phycisphaerales bacterium]|nr:hypothetical protein [Phycisphaerales bacterium]